MAVSTDTLCEAVGEALRSASTQTRSELQNELAVYAATYPGTWVGLKTASSPMLRKLVAAIIEGVA